MRTITAAGAATIPAQETQTKSDPPALSPSPNRSMTDPSLSSSSSLRNEARPRSSRKGSCKTNPFVIEVDLQFPELNFPFRVSNVRHMEHNGFERSAIEIRTIVGVGDQKFWRAEMDDSDPAMKGRAILIQGRSGNASYDAVASYHRNNFSSFSEGIHLIENEEIENNPSRQALFWRLIMPEDVPLENAFFSGDSRIIAMTPRGVKFDVEGHEIKTVICGWKIAKAGPGIRIATVPELSTDDLFA